MRRVAGISPLIDSCDGMIRKKVGYAFRRISPTNKRWLDEEDLLQELLLAAFLTEKNDYIHQTSRFRRRTKTKFSTFLYRKLDWEVSGFVAGLRYQKRDAQVLELDAPLPSGDALVTSIPAASGAYAYGPGTVTAADKVQWQGQQARPALAAEYFDCARSFIRLCRRLSDDAKAVLIRGFLFSDSRGATQEACNEIGEVAGKLRVGVNDLRLIGQDENLRKLILTLVGRYVMLSEGTEEALRVLRCQECDGQFTIAALREPVRFFVGPMTCRSCLVKLSRVRESCFAKDFDPSATECRLHCLDRAACKLFTKERNMKDKVEEAAQDVDFSEVEDKAKAVSEKKKASKKPVAKAEKTAKPEKAAKEEKPSKKGPAKEKTSKSAEREEELAKQEKAEGWAFTYTDVPKEVVQWPYRRGSTMLYVFQHMLKGINKNKLRKDVIVAKSGAKEGTAFADLNDKQKERGEKAWLNNLKIMQRFEHREHTWKLDEEGDQYKIHSVKYTGKQASSKKKAKAAA